MTKKIKAIIFDLDGTLYSFDRNRGQVFGASKFGQKIQENCLRFFQNTCNLNELEAQNKYQDLKTRYDGQVSLGVEAELKIDRRIYFAQTWDLNPAEFLETNPKLKTELKKLKTKTGILSAAPQIWVNRVLDFLKVRQHFEPAIFTGDPDLRKPNPLAFMQLADFWSLSPKEILAIGDQEETDILPARSLGMLTARVGESTDSVADFKANDVIELLTNLRKDKLI